MEKTHILLIDDDEGLADVLSMALEDAGFIVRHAADGAKGWALFCEEEPDLVVLDLLMPELDGLEVCRRIRGRSTTPVLMLTSRAEEMDKILGLEMGADDYVTKPFSTRELVARIRAALRRVAMHQSDGGKAERVQRGPLRLDRDRRHVYLGEEAIALTATEFDLLWTVTQRPGHVFSRQALVDAVYGEEVVVADRTIDTFVKRLRRKLAAVDPAFTPLQTVRAVGYRFEEPNT